MATLKKTKKPISPLTILVSEIHLRFLYMLIYFLIREFLPPASHSLSQTPSQRERHYCLHINKQKQMWKHWCETFLILLSSFDSQMPQGHCYNLTITRVFSKFTVLPIRIDSLSSSLFFSHTEIMFHPLLQQGMWHDPLKSTLRVMHTVFFYLSINSRKIMLMSHPPASNAQYSITADQSLLFAMNTFTQLESNVPCHVFLDGEISYRLSKFGKILRLNEKMIIYFSNQQHYGQHTFRDD